MRIYNRSRKIIGILGEPLLPGGSRELPSGYEKHPSIMDYLEKGEIEDADNPSGIIPKGGISDSEKAKIAEEAIARYKAEQEKLAAAQAVMEEEITALKAMKKPELLTKAVGMGLEVKDDDTAEELREKIADAIRQTKGCDDDRA